MHPDYRRLLEETEFAPMYWGSAEVVRAQAFRDAELYPGFTVFRLFPELPGPWFFLDNQGRSGGPFETSGEGMSAALKQPGMKSKDEVIGNG